MHGDVLQADLDTIDELDRAPHGATTRWPPPVARTFPAPNPAQIAPPPIGSFPAPSPSIPLIAPAVFVAERFDAPTESRLLNIVERCSSLRRLGPVTPLGAPI